MQSDIACHIGMMGKFFCRVCHVKGYEAPLKSKRNGATAGPLNNDGDNLPLNEVEYGASQDQTEDDASSAEGEFLNIIRT